MTVWAEPDEPGDDEPTAPPWPTQPVPVFGCRRPPNPQYVCAQCDSDRWALFAGQAGYWLPVRFVCWDCGQRWTFQLGALGECVLDDDDDGGQRW